MFTKPRKYRTCARYRPRSVAGTVGAMRDVANCCNDRNHRMSRSRRLGDRSALRPTPVRASEGRCSGALAESDAAMSSYSDAHNPIRDWQLVELMNASDG